MSIKKDYVGNFRDLIAYRKALIFRREIYKLIKVMPISERLLKTELMKASCSVCANLAEGNASYYYGREYEHFDIALCKVAKYQSLMNLAFLLGFIKKEDYKRLEESSKEIARIIRALMKRLEKYLVSTVETSRDFLNVNSADLEAIIEKAKLFQMSINIIVGTIPAEEKYNVCDQLLRAVSSLYETMVKSMAVTSDAGFQKLNYCLGSLSEVRSFLDICVMENYLTREEYLMIDKEAGEIQKMLIEAMN